MSTIIVVSGLPRSGTSLMMQMLQRGGLDVGTDNIRTADDDNPRGYFELEAVKSLAKDASWIPAMHGKAIKVISQLLFSLPTSENYSVILMQRDLDEVLASQSAMLQRVGRGGASQAEILRKAFKSHLARLEQWLPNQQHIGCLPVSFLDAIESPLSVAREVATFLAGEIAPELDVNAMAAASEQNLYRNRSSSH